MTSHPTESSPTSPDDAPKWQPLNSIERRVLGVLVEKAKTTPDAYPLTLNALRNGCNQKSNRFPALSLEENQVEDALERLRALGAAVEVQGDGRVAKHRHLMYPWLGVEKTELAVMTELLLRGAQTLGELRGRAARMEPIADIGALRPVLESLQAKNLIIYMTPPGRGCVVTHNLYKDREMEKLRAEYGSITQPPQHAAPEATHQPPRTAAPTPSQPSAPSAAPILQEQSDASSQEVESLRTQLEEQRDALVTFRTEVEQQITTLQTDLEDIKRQLGI